MKTIMIAVLILLSASAFAATKCEADGRGGFCCWDSSTDGPWKPVGCS